jgi:hypothetical protein
VRDVFNVSGKIDEDDHTCLFMASLPKLYDSIMMSLLEKKSDLTMSEVTVVLLDSKSLRRHEEVVSRSSSALVTILDWRR